MDMKDLLARLLGGVELGCHVDADLEASEKKLADLPAGDADSFGLSKWGAGQMQRAAEDFTKRAKERELELELFKLKFPFPEGDDSDVAHARKHLHAWEADLEILRREALLFGRLSELLKQLSSRQ